MTQDSVVDTSKPSPGRIYDYFLGGSHNFEVDRQAAEQVIKLVPFVTKYARLQRWSLQDLAMTLTGKLGFDVIIDFASGLPTNDHIHHVVPEGTIVIYSDYDPVVVEYAREILGNTPNVYYFQADARQPENLLTSPKIGQILNGRRDVAFVYWGVSTFLGDEDVTRAAAVLYAWANSGSCWAFNAQTGNKEDPAVKRVIELYKAMGSTLHYRSVEEYQVMVRPWEPNENGFIPLLEWHGFDQSELSQEDAEAFGPMGGGYGAYLKK